jgi:hypothetical protein
MSLEAAAPAEAAPVETSSSPTDLVGLFAAELAAEDAAAAPAKPAPTVTESDPPADAVEADQAAPEQGTEAAEGTEPDDGAETPPVVQAINAPSGMSEEDRQRFAQLPPEVQTWVTQREQQRLADYTRKTQEVANQTKAAAAERQQLGAQLEQYNAFLTNITGQKIEPPDPNLQYSDPDGYQQQLGQYVQAKHRQEQAVAEQARVTEQQSRMQQQSYQEFVQTEGAKLYEMMPEFKDPKTGPALKKAVVEYAQAQGFGEVLPKATALEVSVLVKAMRYDAAQKAKSSAVVVQPAAPRSAKPGPAKAPGSRTSSLANAVSNLKATGSRASLAEAYMAELSTER